MFSYGEQLSIDNGISIGAAWLNSSNRDISNAIYGDQYLKMEFVFDKDMPRDNTVYRFASDVNVSLENISTRLPANEKYVLEGVYVSSDRRTLICIVKVHITPPGKTEYKLTVMDGLMSGWYEAGSRIAVLSLDAYNRLGENRQEAESVISANIGVDARRYLMLLPDRYYKNFIEWKILEPGKNKLSQDDMEPVNTSHGSDYALSFFTMPSADVTIQGVYGEDEPVIIKYLNLSMNRPVPGQPLAAYATSTTYEVVPVFPMDDDESRFKVEWSPNVTGNAEYNKTYTASVWVKPRLMNYRFAQPIGDSAGFTAHFNYDDSVNDYQSVKNQLKLTISYTTPKAQLLKISPVNPLYYANGTSKENIDSAIKAIRANITTELGFDIADVNWNSVSETSYDPTEKERQEVKVTGTVVLPSDIQNTKTDDHEVVSQEISVTVVVLAANPERELYPPVVSPESCITTDPLSITVTNDERNDKASRVYLISDSGKEVAYTSPIIITPKSRQEVYDNQEGVYTVKGNMILPDDIRNDKDSSHDVVDTGVEICIVILEEKTSGELIPPKADPDSGTLAGTTIVSLIDDPENPVDPDRKLFYLLYKDGELCKTEVYDDIQKILLEQEKEDTSYTLEAYAESRDVISPVATFSYVVRGAEPKIRIAVTDGTVKADEPEAHEKLPLTVTEIEFSGLMKAGEESSQNVKLELSSDPIISWIEDGSDQSAEIAEPGGKYTWIMKVSADQLTLNGKPAPSVFFENEIIVTVNGETAKAVVSLEHDYVMVYRSFVIPMEYTVAYDANGGENAPETQIKTEGEVLKLSDKAPTWVGHKFLGWAIEKDSKKSDYQPGDMYESDQDITLYAVWEVLPGPDPIPPKPDPDPDPKPDPTPDPTPPDTGDANAGNMYWWIGFMALLAMIGAGRKLYRRKLK